MNIKMDILFEHVYSVDFSLWEYTSSDTCKRIRLNADITQLIEEFGEEIFVSLDENNNVLLFCRTPMVIQEIQSIADKFGYDAEMRNANSISLCGDNLVHPNGFARVEVNGRNANSYHNFKDLFMK